MNFIINQDLYNNNNTIYKFNGVYRIDSKKNGYPLFADNDRLKFTRKKEGKEEGFRIIPSDYSNLYFIESKPFNRRLTIKDIDEISLLEKHGSEILEEVYWNIIQINDKEFLIQNNYSKNFIEIIEKSYHEYYPKCSKNLTEITEKNKIQLEQVSDSFKFTFFKLCEEVQLKPEHIEIIEKEPIDVVIKYIDLSDKSLNREGIKQTKKDEENEELRYSVRSILENIPWIRKIFILMPNEKVKYFKPIEEIKDKFVYVNDKEYLGFDSANSNAFQYNLYNMKKFGISDNFLLMDDDCFFGKPINKSQFFYYDEEKRKVLPSVVTDEFTELIKEEVLNEYNKLSRRRFRIKLQSFFGWKLSQLTAFKLLLEEFESPLVNAGFNHNAIPLNIDDMKEIYEFIKNKYHNANDTLYSKERTSYDLQPQSLFNSYLLNVKKRKVNSIPWVYFDLGALEGKNFNIEMFVINTSGDRIYHENQYLYAKKVLKEKFDKPTPYEIIIDNNLKDISINNNNNNLTDNDRSINSTQILQKSDDSFNKLNEDYQKLVESYKKMNETFQQKSIELNNKIESLVNQINIITNESEKRNNFLIKENSEKKYNDLLFYFKIVIIFLIIVVFGFIINIIYCICSKKEKNSEIYQIPTTIDIDKKHNESNAEEENINFK